MRIPVLAANWKMFKTVGETVSYLKEFCALTAGVSGAEIAVVGQDLQRVGADAVMLAHGPFDARTLGEARAHRASDHHAQLIEDIVGFRILDSDKKSPIVFDGQGHDAIANGQARRHALQGFI